jgi:rod shape determining protein RodA
MPIQSRWLRFDFLLLLASLALTGMGLVLIYSATLPPPGQPVPPLSLDSPVLRQAIFALTGLALMALMSMVDYRFLEEVFFRTRAAREQFAGSTQWQRVLASFLHPLYLANVTLLVAVLVIGRITHGSQRWISLGFFELQPSEIAKLLVIITLAKYLSDQDHDVRGARVVAVSLAHVLVPVALIYAQPDLGTAIVLGCIWLGMVIMAGARLRHIFAIAVPALLAAPVAWLYLLQDYQRERVMVFLDPYRDPLGGGYNPIQSLVSVGSGGLWGKGLAAGTQSQLHFLRIQHTDYIFSVLGEELGFVGAVLFFALLAVVLLRMIGIAARSPEPFGQLVVVGVVVMLFSQSFINVAMNTGLMPVTGIPLPFISSGGSSLLTLFLALGLVQSVAGHSKRVTF